MPIEIPALDTRKYQELLDEALARIPVHNPEWTNFNKSDPGVTLIEVFAFMTENLLYRANQIPERNRRKFLSLLGLPLQTSSPARGLLTIANERGPLQTLTLNGGLEARAGQIPYRTDQGLDVLPLEARIFYKRKVEITDPNLQAYYQQLYASFLTDAPDLSKLVLYETVSMPIPTPGSSGVDLSQTVDGLWIALLVRAADKQLANSVGRARQAIGGKTLSLGLVPWSPDASRHLSPIGAQSLASSQALSQAGVSSSLRFQMPVGGSLPENRIPQYRSLPTSFSNDVLIEPGVVQITLPPSGEIQLWDNIDPLELGVDQFPPNLDDTNLSSRVVTWLRISAAPGSQALIYWTGINTVTIRQETRISNERLPDGNGEPDQADRLSHPHVIAETVKLSVNGDTWQAIEDLLSAGPEIPTPDLHFPPGSQLLNPALLPPVDVYQLDAEAGTIRFGDGTHGRRPALGALVRVDYAYSEGLEGNVGTGAINSAPTLPAGVTVSNPLPTWGGVDAESVAQGEKHITRYLRHRDRLVTMEDFETITWRTPGVEIGRVEVLPAFHPTVSVRPGDASGAVTVMVIPLKDPQNPEAPFPDQVFLNAVCDYINPRRLVTTEVFLKPPTYKDIWISVGIQILPGMSAAQVREAVISALKQFLAPLPASPGVPDPNFPTPRQATGEGAGPKGWPLGKSVVALELLAVASRVPGVMLVEGVMVADGAKPAESVAEIAMKKLELPRIAGMSVVVGSPIGLDLLGGQSAITPPPDEQDPGGKGPRVRQNIPAPVVPEECC